jgi:hypothetical protein
VISTLHLSVNSRSNNSREFNPEQHAVVHLARCGILPARGVLGSIEDAGWGVAGIRARKFLGGLRFSQVAHF